MQDLLRSGALELLPGHPSFLNLQISDCHSFHAMIINTKEMNMIPRRITDNDFDTEVIESDRLTLAYFGAVWSEISLIDRITVEAIANIYDDIIKAVMFDFDLCPLTVRKLEIKSVPTVVYFLDGMEVARQEGLLSVTQLHGVIKEHLLEQAKKNTNNMIGTRYSDLSPEE
jgi:thioredoxin 1